MEQVQKKPANGTQTVNRAMQLLRLISSQNREGVRLSEVTEKSGLMKATAHRLLNELVSCGLLMRSSGKLYHLGHFAYELGLTAASHFSLKDICTPSLERLAQKTGDTVFLTVRSGDDSFCLDRQTGDYPIKVFSVEVGHRQPLGVGAAGLALLSSLNDADIETILSNNAKNLHRYGSLTNEHLRHLIQTTRQNGYSHISDFAIPGVSGIGMAVVDRVGQPILSISVTTISSRMTTEHRNLIQDALAQETRWLKDFLDHRNPALINR